jgi:hypothetical protein
MTVFVVHQAEGTSALCSTICNYFVGIVIERLGRFHRVLNSGIHLIVPLIDRPRQFTWRKTAIADDGTIVDETYRCQS